MLHTQRRKCDASMNASELRSVLLALPEDEWQPSILGQQRFFLRLAGVENEVDLDRLSRASTRVRRRSPDGVGDVFFRGGVLLYLVEGSRDRSIVLDEYGRMLRTAEPNSEGIEIGAMGGDREVVEQQLNDFAAALEAAVRTALDGRRARHLKFHWEDVAPSTTRLDRVTKINEEEEGPAFEKAELIDEHVRAAGVLADRGARELMLLIAEAVFVRQKEILERRGKKQEEIREVLQQLQATDLISTESLLECRRHGTRLSRFPNAADLEDPKIGSLLCASCGAHFRDENVSEGYSLSPLGRHLIKKSHWMTVWLTNLLVRLGIPEENVVWNLSEVGEEVDIIAEFLGQLWIFELKDREFGAGDAHPFNYRQVRYGADRAIIVTADKVSRDAKRIFEELGREDPLGRRPKIVYIEGLENADATLRQEISSGAVAYARQRLSVLSENAGIDFGVVLQAKFGAVKA